MNKIFYFLNEIDSLNETPTLSISKSEVILGISHSIPNKAEGYTSTQLQTLNFNFESDYKLEA